MNIETNEKLIKRNAMIGQATMIGGLAALVASLFISYQFPDQITLSFIVLILGFLFSQLGIFFTTRYGRRPRPDELLNEGLKGLDGKYSLYHYKTPTAHFLVGPAGLWVLMPRHQRGVIAFEKGRWKQKGGGAFAVYMRLFGQEGLGRPDIEVASEIDAMTKYLQKKIAGGDVPEVRAMLVFTNDKVDVQIEPDADTPAVTVTLPKLKETLRKLAKSKPVPPQKAAEIQKLLTD
jgi:hypothetical protein